ncbi:Barwin [Corchorus olitorius]|uniref:Barwin n=1 Tax=Corchorus olitorius TaxID=93759 RepID=A0A1R3JN54_9ROSI|nr:Barwin [Corchorus olitorius]
MGRIRMSMILLLGCLVASATAQSASNAIAFWAEFNAKEHHWDLNEVGVYCSQWEVFADKPLEWRSKYNWTAFCGVGPVGLEACGRCLNVTNLHDPNGEPVTVRILDECTIPSLVLERDVFDAMDTPDHQGITIGHLNVSYKFVDCGDYPSIRLYPDE